MLNNFFSKNLIDSEIMSKNVVEPERPQLAIRLRVACWISKATRAQAHAIARAPTPTPKHTPPTHAHTQMNTLALTRASVRTHAHTHREICKTYCFCTATRSYLRVFSAADFSPLIHTCAVSVGPQTVQSARE